MLDTHHLPYGAGSGAWERRDALVDEAGGSQGGVHGLYCPLRGVVVGGEMREPDITGAIIGEGEGEEIGTLVV